MRISIIYLLQLFFLTISFSQSQSNNILLDSDREKNKDYFSTNSENIVNQNFSRNKENTSYSRKNENNEILELWKNEPFGDYVPNNEISDRRSANEKHFQREDGQVDMYYSSEPINYLEEGNWKTIYNTIIEDNNGIYKFSNLNNTFKSYYPENIQDGFKTLLNGQELLEMLNATMYYESNGQKLDVLNINSSKGSVKGNKLTYEKVYGNAIDLLVTQSGGKRKLDYIIKDRSAVNEAYSNAQYLVFSEEILLPKGWTAKLDNDVILLIDDTGEVALAYEKPTVFDSSENALEKKSNTGALDSTEDYFMAEMINYPQIEADQNSKPDRHISYDINVTGNNLIVLTKVNLCYLLDKKRVYPVVVDPTLSGSWSTTSWTYSSANQCGFTPQGVTFTTGGAPLGSSITNLSVTFTQLAAMNFYDPFCNYFGATSTNFCNSWYNFGIFDFESGSPTFGIGVAGCNINNTAQFNCINPNRTWLVELRSLDNWVYVTQFSWNMTITYETVTAPTSITGTTSICSGSSTTLTASGGTSNAGSTAIITEWFTGSCGGTLIGTGNPISVSPTATTIYYARRVGQCSTTACESVTVNITPFGQDGALTATTPTTVCLGQPITVSAAGGNGTPRYWIQSPVGAATWNIVDNQAANAPSNGYSFTPTAVGTYRVHARWQNSCGFCWDEPGHDWTTNNLCPDFAFVDFTVVDAPTANAGPAMATICQGATSGPMGGSVGGSATGGTWSGGAGTWTNANDPANATYTAGASESGVITLTLTTTGGCGAPVIATKTITVTPQRTVSTASVSPTACLDTGIDPIIHNTTGVTSIVSSTGLPTGVTASYSANQITISGVATQAGEFEYTITPDGCGTAVATGTITIVPYAARVAPLGPQCSGATLNFEAVINFPGSIYTWTVEPLPAGISASVTSGSASTFSTSITNTTGANFFATAPNHYISVIQTVNGVSCESFFNPTIHAPSTAPTSIDVAGLPYCLGGEATLTRNGGSLSTGANWEWFSASCGGTGEGTGTSIVVSPTSTTTYFVRASAGTACPASSCEQVTINTPAPNHALSSGATATCLVHQNGWVHFLDASGNLIASINSNGQNLGNVDAQVFAPGTPITGESCDSPGDALFFTEVMGRHWVITPQHQPTSNVSVRLPFNETAELNPLITSSQANQNPLDDVTGIGDLGLSKYSGPANVDGNLSNNCFSAGGNENTTFHGQTGNGSVSSFIAGHPANDRFVDFSISSFSEFWLHGSSAGSPLPVEFDQFSTVCTDDFVVLNWTTKSEVNASHWVIERSRDGWNWENIGHLNANGNTNATSHYEWKDPITGSNFDGYYRLQQVDFDGTATNYGPFHAQCNSKAGGILLNVFPNPAQDMVNLNFSIPQGQSHAFDVQLLNATGQTIAVRNVQIQQNNFTQTWETQQLNNGMYSFKICASNGECYLQKFVIHR